MPSESDMRMFMQHFGPKPEAKVFQEFTDKFSGVDSKTHADALKRMLEAEARVADLEREIEAIKAHYEAKLKAAE